MGQLINAGRLLELEAIEAYRQCPKTITVIRHADLTDDSEFHCIWSGYNTECLKDGRVERYPYEIKKVFMVPKQTVRTYVDPVLGKYLAVRVRPKFEIKLYPREEFWLFVRAENASGFLVPLDADISEYELRNRSKSQGFHEFLSQNWFPGNRQMA